MTNKKSRGGESPSPSTSESSSAFGDRDYQQPSSPESEPMPPKNKARTRAAKKNAAAAQAKPAPAPRHSNFDPEAAALIEKEHNAEKRVREHAIVDEYYAQQAIKKAAEEEERLEAIRIEDAMLQLQVEKARIEDFAGMRADDLGLEGGIECIKTLYENGRLAEYVDNAENPSLNRFVIMYGEEPKLVHILEIPLPGWKKQTYGMGENQIEDGDGQESEDGVGQNFYHTAEVGDGETITIDDFDREMQDFMRECETSDEDEDAEPIASSAYQQRPARRPAKYFPFEYRKEPIPTTVTWSQLSDPIKFTIYEELRMTRKDDAAFRDLGLDEDEQEEYILIHKGELDRVMAKEKTNEDLKDDIYHLRRKAYQVMGLNGEPPRPEAEQGVVDSEDVMDLIDEHTWEGEQAINWSLSPKEVYDGMSFLKSLDLPSEWLQDRIGVQLSELNPSSTDPEPAFHKFFEQDADGGNREPEEVPLEDMDRDEMTREQLMARIEAGGDIISARMKYYRKELGEKEGARWAQGRGSRPDYPQLQQTPGRKPSNPSAPSSSRPRVGSMQRGDSLGDEDVMELTPNSRTPKKPINNQRRGSGSPSGIRLRLGLRNASIERISPSPRPSSSPSGIRLKLGRGTSIDCTPPKVGQARNASSPSVGSSPGGIFSSPSHGRGPGSDNNESPDFKSFGGQRRVSRLAGPSTTPEAFGQAILDAVAPRPKNRNMRADFDGQDFVFSSPPGPVTSEGDIPPSNGRRQIAPHRKNRIKRGDGYTQDVNFNSPPGPLMSEGDIRPRNDRRQNRIRSPHNAEDYWSFSSPDSQGIGSPENRGAFGHRRGQGSSGSFEIGRGHASSGSFGRGFGNSMSPSRFILGDEPQQVSSQSAGQPSSGQNDYNSRPHQASSQGPGQPSTGQNDYNSRPHQASSQGAGQPSSGQNDYNSRPFQASSQIPGLPSFGENYNIRDYQASFEKVLPLSQQPMSHFTRDNPEYFPNGRAVVEQSIAAFLIFVSSKILDRTSQQAHRETFHKWAVFLGLMQRGSPILANDWAPLSRKLVEFMPEFYIQVAKCFDKVRPDMNEVMDIKAMKELNGLMKMATMIMAPFAFVEAEAQPMYGYPYDQERAGGEVDGQLGGQAGERVNGQVGGQVNEQVGEQVNEQASQQADESAGAPSEDDWHFAYEQMARENGGNYDFQPMEGLE